MASKKVWKGEFQIVLENPKSDVSLGFLKIAKRIYETPKNEWGGLTFLSKVKKRA